MKRSHKRFTLRVPADLYARSVRVAKRHHTSLNALTCAGLQHVTSREAFADLKNAFDLIGHDSDSDARYFFKAQSEVICGDE